MHIRLFRTTTIQQTQEIQSGVFDMGLIGQAIVISVISGHGQSVFMIYVHFLIIFFIFNLFDSVYTFASSF